MSRRELRPAFGGVHANLRGSDFKPSQRWKTIAARMAYKLVALIDESKVGLSYIEKEGSRRCPTVERTSYY